MIASAWCVAFIALFVFVLAEAPPGSVSPGLSFFLFAMAVTGCGWLWYRGDVKNRRKKENVP
jgi:hypothetical protein